MHLVLSFGDFQLRTIREGNAGKGYHFLWQVYERVILSVNNTIQKGKGLGPGKEPSLISNCVRTSPCSKIIKRKTKQKSK